MGKTWVLTALLATALWGASADLDHARKLYSRTDYESSLKVLEAIPVKDGAVYDLMGRNYLMRGDFKRASEVYEKAVVTDPNRSEYYHWLGKTYGRRAETASMFTAPGYASKARQNFEKAVELNPKNLEAINDLFEYYLQAPGFLGGGLDKASALAQKIAVLDAIEGHYALARIAERRKDSKTAEVQLRRAVELAPMQVGRVIDLAKFLANQGRHQEAEQTFQRAEKIAPDSPRLMFEKAEAYIRSGRNSQQARELLKRYLASPLSPDDPPRSAAEKLLKEVGG